MIIFAQSYWLYLLLLVPLILILHGVGEAMHNRRVKAFGDPALVEALMPSRSRAASPFQGTRRRRAQSASS